MNPAQPNSAQTNPVTFRPVKLRRVCWVLAPVVVAFFVVIGLMLGGSVGSMGGVFQPSDQVAMGALGLFGAAAILLFTRPKVTADAERVVIRNVIGGYTLPWSLVESVRFDKTSPWVTLELVDGDIVAVMAVQVTDKDYAVEAVRQLRAIHAAARAPQESIAP